MMLRCLLLIAVLLPCCAYAEDRVIKVIPLNNRSAIELQGVIRPLLEDSERIMANGANLIVKATALRQIDIQLLIQQLDTRLVNLLVTVLRTQTKTAEQLNHSARVRLNVSSQNTFNISGNSQGQFSDIKRTHHSENMQQVRTLNGQSALIKMGNVHPITQINIADVGGGQAIVSSNTQLVEATTGFMVTPNLTGSLVVMDITPWSNTMKTNGTLAIQGGHSSIQATLGEWVEMGGISEQRQDLAMGNLSHYRATINNEWRVLIKVEK